MGEAWLNDICFNKGSNHPGERDRTILRLLSKTRLKDPSEFLLKIQANSKQILDIVRYLGWHSFLGRWRPIVTHCILDDRAKSIFGSRELRVWGWIREIDLWIHLFGIFTSKASTNTAGTNNPVV